MPSREPKQERSQHRRDQLLRATVELIAAGGVRSVSHRTVAKQAGLPASTVGYFYESIDQLITEAIREYTNKATRVYLSKVTSQLQVGTVVKALSEVGTNRAVGTAHYEIYLEGARNKALARPVAEMVDRFRGVAEVSLEELGMPLPRHFAPAFQALFDGFALQVIANPNHPPDPGLLEQAILALMAGLLATNDERANLLSRLEPTQ